MAIKINSRVALENFGQKKNLFSKLQNLTFSNFVQSTFIQSRMSESGAHLDLESQEILVRLKSNIEKLADASGRVEFMMGELSQIMKKGV